MGKFIVIEGLDGSGKSTQGELLKHHYEELGKKVRMLSFPCYKTKGCTLVEMYLSGELGECADDTNGYAASMLFASDRYVSYVTDWKKDYLLEDTVIIATRYTTSNAYHQLSKMPRDKWDDFLFWLYDFEFTKLGLPKPDEVIFLEMPESFSSKRVEERCSDTGAVKDIHEKDKDYLNRTYAAAMYTADKLGWRVINCTDGEKQKSKEEISQILINIIDYLR